MLVFGNRVVLELEGVSAEELRGTSINDKQDKLLGFLGDTREIAPGIFEAELFIIPSTTG